MTALELQILLHYYTAEGDFKTADGVPHAVSNLQALNMLDLDRDTSWLKLTDKARFYLRHILATPLPVSVWQIPGAAP